MGFCGARQKIAKAHLKPYQIPSQSEPVEQPGCFSLSQRAHESKQRGAQPYFIIEDIWPCSCSANCGQRTLRAETAAKELTARRYKDLNYSMVKTVFVTP